MSQKEQSHLEAKERVMSSSDEKNKPDEEWKPMSIGTLDHFEDISAPKPEASDFNALFSPEGKKKKKQMDSFVPFVSQDGDSVKITEFEETSEEDEERSAGSGGAEEVPLPHISEEELAVIREAARKEGYDQGHAEGLAKGEKDGFPKGEKDGFAKGEASGFEEGMKQAAAMAESLEALISSMNTVYSDLIKKNEIFIIGLICRAVEKIVYGLLVIDHNIAKRAVMEAFSLIPEPEEVTIRINTEDYEFIEHVKDDFFRQIASLKQVTVIADPGVPKGDCQLECSAGEVDMNIEKRLEAIKKKIIELS